MYLLFSIHPALQKTNFCCDFIKNKIVRYFIFYLLWFDILENTKVWTRLNDIQCCCCKFVVVIVVDYFVRLCQGLNTRYRLRNQSSFFFNSAADERILYGYLKSYLGIPLNRLLNCSIFQQDKDDEKFVIQVQKFKMNEVLSCTLRISDKLNIGLGEKFIFSPIYWEAWVVKMKSNKFKIR